MKDSYLEIPENLVERFLEGLPLAKPGRSWYQMTLVAVTHHKIYFSLDWFQKT